MAKLSKTKEPKYAKALEKEATRPTSVRIPESVFANFNKAVSIAEANGYSLSLSEVASQAAQEAAQEIFEMFPQEHQEELKL